MRRVGAGVLSLAVFLAFWKAVTVVGDYPEFILPSVWGERLPIYQDEFLASEANKSAAYSNMTEGATQGDAYTVRRNERSY